MDISMLPIIWMIMMALTMSVLPGWTAVLICASIPFWTSASIIMAGVRTKPPDCWNFLESQIQMQYLRSTSISWKRPPIIWNTAGDTSVFLIWRQNGKLYSATTLIQKLFTNIFLKSVLSSFQYYKNTCRNISKNWQSKKTAILPL